MVGTSMIGNRRNVDRYRVTSLPAEARSATRMLRYLGNNPEYASRVLLDSIPDEYAFKAVVKQTIDEIGRYGWKRFYKGQAESRMSMAVMYAIQAHIQNEKKNMKKQRGGGTNKSNSAKAVSSKDTRRKDPPISAQDKNVGPQTTTIATRDSAALVSDYSTAASDEEEEVTRSSALATSRSQQVRHIWSILLESLHLQISARTTVTWGKKKNYEIYQLCSPASLVQELPRICETVSAEFRSIYQTECRVYAHRSSASQMYIQLNIGKALDLQDESNLSRSGFKKKPRPNEYVALVEEGSCLLALTAGRKASSNTCRFTKFVLCALEAALATAARTQQKDKSSIRDSMVPTRFGDWTGTEPHELLDEALASKDGRAVGRFAQLARPLGPDPLTEFHTVSTECMVSRQAEQERLNVGRKHGRQAARLVQHDAVACNANGVLVDGSAAQTASRKRARQDELGGRGDCPKMQRVAWKWTGDFEDVKFKCGVVMEGPNVFEGLGDLMKAGLTKETLPDYVRDAPMLGSSTITVDHGEYGGTESFAAV